MAVLAGVLLSYVIDYVEVYAKVTFNLNKSCILNSKAYTKVKGEIKFKGLDAPESKFRKLV